MRLVKVEVTAYLRDDDTWTTIGSVTVQKGKQDYRTTTFAEGSKTWQESVETAFENLGVLS